MTLRVSYLRASLLIQMEFRLIAHHYINATRNNNGVKERVFLRLNDGSYRGYSLAVCNVDSGLRIYTAVESTAVYYTVYGFTLLATR